MGILKVAFKIVVKYLHLYKFLLVEENDKIVEFGDILKTPFFSFSLRVSAAQVSVA